MYTNHNEIKEYPFKGQFYRGGIVDESLSLLEQTEMESIVLDTICDITENKHKENENYISATYNVYFPIGDKLEVKNGDLFRGNMYGVEINGKVIGVFATQLGGANAYVKDLDV